MLYAPTPNCRLNFMPSSRHHSEWLSLIEVSGPFLSVPVLERVFPQGLDAHDPDHVRVLRLAFDEWEEDGTATRHDQRFTGSGFASCSRRRSGCP